jgi:hypothetical protein
MCTTGHMYQGNLTKEANAAEEIDRVLIDCVASGLLGAPD